MSAQLTALLRAENAKLGALLGRTAPLDMVAWIVAADYRSPDGRTLQRIDVIYGRLSERPDAARLVPDDAELLRLEVFPASRFDALPVSSRGRYRAHYTRFLTWCKAHALCKPASDLAPGIEINPLTIEADVQHWLRPIGSHFSPPPEGSEPPCA